MAKLSIEQKRMYIMNAYPGLSWHRKVSMMPPGQVCAVYVSIKNREALNGIRERHRSEPKKKSEDYHQIDIWEYMCIKKGGMRNDD